jgi:GT2 family glycosyltransferase
MDQQTQPDPVQPQPAKTTTVGAAQPRCTVGLLTWNAGEDGPRCVESILKQTGPDARIDWTDNASTDGTFQRLRTAFPCLPEATVNSENLGFCTPHNGMLARCVTPYYLALNQDIVLAPDYVRRLCDWMDGEPELALVSGVTLRPPADPAAPSEGDVIDSAGLVFPRARYHFHLGMGRLYGARYAVRRRVPGVEGAAMLMRVAACRRAAVPPGEVFADGFFAYCEEVDLAIRLARLGFSCGVDGGAVAVHRGKGSGGHAQVAIRAHFLANHWLVALRNEPWSLMLRELPYILRGELQYWLREYLRHPAAFARALGILPREAAAARRFYRDFERRFGPTLPGLLRYRREALAAVRADRSRSPAASAEGAG